MATIKIKRKGKWVNPDELPVLREQEKPPAPEPPPVDVAALPAKQELDPDVPMEQLFFERPEVRAYITKTGELRSGLTTAQQDIGRKILDRYR